MENKTNKNAGNGKKTKKQKKHAGKATILSPRVLKY
jgi:hypothetical protein